MDYTLSSVNSQAHVVILNLFETIEIVNKTFETWIGNNFKIG